MQSEAFEYPNDKAAMYHVLKTQLQGLTDGVPHLTANLANASALLNQALEDINWVGFYLLEGERLVLGPFQGKPACIEIPIGKGVCGTAVSEDVLAFTQELLGNENAADLRTAFGGALRRLSGSEDFAAISEKIPSSIALLFMGNTQAGYKYGNHHPKSRFNDDFLYVGAAVYANTAIEWLKKNK